MNNKISMLSLTSRSILYKDAVDFLCRCNRSSHNGLSAGSPREYRPVENHYTGLFPFNQ